MKNIKTDIVIVGCGVSGLYCALNLPHDKNILIITKGAENESDSFLAQGGICVMHDENDYESFFEDTMKAGHYENDKMSVDIMIRSSRETIGDLINIGTDFEKRKGELVYTKEGAHSRPRILFHEDQTGKEITSKLLSAVKKLPNVTLKEHITMLDLLTDDNVCVGIIAKNENGEVFSVNADYTVLATGGIGGLFEHSTNFPHLTGDALAVSLMHGVELESLDYIQIHPTTLYSAEKGRAFLISESVRGEGAVLLNAKGERFVNELLPRDKVSEAIFKEMEKEGTKHVWLSLAPIKKEEILSHFPTIYQKCLEAGYDITKEPIPVVPAQHYFMGGIKVGKQSQTNMQRLYAVGETACNGVHGKNRLASNSLLESLVFAKRCAIDIKENYLPLGSLSACHPQKNYDDIENVYKNAVLAAIEKEKKRHG